MKEEALEVGREAELRLQARMAKANEEVSFVYIILTKVWWKHIILYRFSPFWHQNFENRALKIQRFQKYIRIYI